jgi:hypothetical protein
MNDEDASGYLLCQIISNCLNKMTLMNMKSIAFPAIGAGSLKYPSAVVARHFLDEVSSFLRCSTVRGLHINFVIYASDTNVREAFEFEFDIYSRINAMPNYWSQFPSGFAYDEDFLLVDVDLMSNEGKSVFEDFREKFYENTQIKHLQVKIKTI